MRITQKQKKVFGNVNKKFFLFPVECELCGDIVFLEFMYKVTDKYYCTRCCKSHEEAYDHTFPRQITPADIIIRLERKKAQGEVYKIIEKITNLPDGEVSPSVENILLSHSPEI